MHEDYVSHLVSILLGADTTKQKAIAEFIKTSAEEALRQHGEGFLRADPSQEPTAH